MDVTSADGTSIHYEVYGEGPTVLLHHGSLMEGASWREAGYVEALSRFRSVVLDQRGYGRSDRSTDPAAHSAENYVNDLLAVADDVGADRFAVGGFSWGTIGAWRVAAEYPDRVQALFAIGGWHPNLYRWDREVMEQTRIEPARQIGVEGICEFMKVEEAPLPQWWVDQVLACDRDVFIATRYAGIEMTELAPARVTVPTLLVSGAKEDRDRDSLLVAGSLENAEAVIVEGRGHCQNFLAPETIAAVTGFLEKNLT